MSADIDPRLHRRIGALTRELHDAMRALGYDRSLSAAAEALPDARDRLAYIATLTGRAAERVLCAVEEAQAEQARIADDVASLLSHYPATAAATPDADQAQRLRTRELLERVAQGTRATRERLHAIMMAQDFHDLSGQVIKRVTDVASRVEASLVDLLVETRPDPAPAQQEEGLAGPAIRPSSDTVSSQGEVDDLLASLGF
jgi:chemotaxis protein CheZ